MFTKAKDAEAIRAFAQERGISRLVHFTPFNNLLGIANLNGIWARHKIEKYARAEQDQFLLDYISYNDEHRFDRRIDCVNLSIEHINHFLFRRFRDAFADQCDTWCVVEISPECLEKEGTVFTTGNAASSYVRRHGTQSGFNGLQALYAETVTSGNMRGTRTEMRTPSLREAHPTSPQAEVLFPEEIPLSLITAFVFEDDSKCARARAALEMENPGLALPPCIVRASDFEPRT